MSLPRYLTVPHIISKRWEKTNILYSCQHLIPAIILLSSVRCKVFSFASCSICMLLGGSGQISEWPAHYLLHARELYVYREAYRMRSNLMNQTSSGLPRSLYFFFFSIILNFLVQRTNKAFLPPNHHIYWCFIHRHRSWKMAFVHLTWVAFRRFLTLI